METERGRVALRAYAPGDAERLLAWMADFFGVHAALLPGAPSPDARALPKTLDEWLGPQSRLFLICEGGAAAGFLRLSLRGPQVVWVEDLYVDPSRRGRGVAGAALAAAEAMARAMDGVTAVCIDVVPRNEAALRLYHRLGYTGLSLLTLRKPLDEPPRDAAARLFGLDFEV